MKRATSWLAVSAAVLAAGWGTRMRHILLVVIFGVSLIDNAYAKAYDKDSAAGWPLWDGKESVADYAKRAGIKDVEKTLDLGGGVAMKLTLIPAGKYLRGLREEEVEVIEGVRVLVREADKGWNSGNGPQREVTISKPFYMGIYEVTQEQFQQIMGFNPSAIGDSRNTKPELFVGKNRPVNNVGDDKAIEFCNKVSAKTGIKVSLPTAAQREYACKAGTTTAFYWGDDPAEGAKYGNFADNSLTTEGLDKYLHNQVENKNKNYDDGFDKTAPVGSFKPNPWGLYDMLGNVTEWVSDWNSTSYFGAPTVDPAGPAYMVGASYRLAKGGAFLAGPANVFGHAGHAPYLITHVGFRVIAAVPSAGDHEAKAGTPKVEVKKAPRTGPVDPKRRVPAGCRAEPGAQAEPYTKSGWAQAIIHEASGMELVYIPAGSFLMGTSKEAKERPYMPDAAQHRVTLTKGFYMGRTEVTQAQWEKVMGQNPSQFKNAGPEAPVESVSLESCQGFCEKAGGGMRLPTEAEWEYACRAGTEGSYAGELDEMGWYLENSDGTTHPVGQKKPNAWGLYDMHGNVWEWCRDHDSRMDSEDAVTDPTGPAKGSGLQPRVIKGGGWGDYSSYCRSAMRLGFNTTEFSGKPVNARGCYLGCRVVIPAAGAP